MFSLINSVYCPHPHTLIDRIYMYYTVYTRAYKEKNTSKKKVISILSKKKFQFEFCNETDMHGLVFVVLLHDLDVCNSYNSARDF